MTDLLTELTNAITAVLAKHGADQHRDTLVQAVTDRLVMPAGEAPPAFLARLCALFNAEVVPH